MNAKEVVAEIAKGMNLTVIPNNTVFNGETMVELENSKLTVHFEPKDLPKIKRFVKSILKTKTPPPVIDDYADILIAFDPEYFDYEDEKRKVTLPRAAYGLATFIFDHDAGEATLADMRKRLPPHLYALALNNYYEGHHDT